MPRLKESLTTLADLCDPFKAEWRSGDLYCSRFRDQGRAGSSKGNGLVSKASTESW